MERERADVSTLGGGKKLQRVKKGVSKAHRVGTVEHDSLLSDRNIRAGYPFRKKRKKRCESGVEKEGRKAYINTTVRGGGRGVQGEARSPGIKGRGRNNPHSQEGRDCRVVVAKKGKGSQDRATAGKRIQCGGKSALFIDQIQKEAVKLITKRKGRTRPINHSHGGKE